MTSPRAVRGALLVAAAGIAGCALPPSGGEEVDERTPTDLARPVEELAEAVQDLGRFPVVPPTADVHVGDVYVFETLPIFGAEASGGLSTARSARWLSLEVASQLEAEYRERRAWRDGAGRSAPDEPAEEAPSDPLVPYRRQLVDLHSLAHLSLATPEVEPFVPAEIAPVLGSWGPYRASIVLGTAESSSLSADTLIDQLVDAPEDEGRNPVLRPEHLRGLPVAREPGASYAYLVVVTEVLSIRAAEATLRKLPAASPEGPAGSAPGPIESTPPDVDTVTGEDPAVAAIRRADRLNEALAESDVEDRIEGAVEFVTVTDDSVSLRRTWDSELALAVRGITMEVDVSTGEVRRTAALGLELPEFATARVVESREEESEVLEERRRGAKKEEISPEDRRKTRLYWDYGPRFDARDGDLSLILGGRLHADVATFSEDEDIVAAFGEPDPGFDVRRAFLELGGVYRKLDFNFWLNFAEVGLLDEDEVDFDSVDFRNVFVGVRDLPVVGGVRVGYFKEPFGLEEITSSNDITFMERSLTDAFVERRNLGVMLTRRFTGERRMTASLGVFRDMDNNLDVSDGYGVTGRVTGAPVLSDDGLSVLHLGGSATYRSTGDDMLQFAAQPESAQAQVMVDTGVFAAEREVRAGLEIGGVRGPVSLQSETIIAASDSGSGLDDQVFWSTYLMGSYVLTGEHRSYRPRVGAFGSVHPDRPVNEGGWGALEATSRYSYLDLDSGSVQGGVLHDWTLGLNWYANDNMRLMLNYILAHPEGVGYEHILQARLQLAL